MSNGQVADEVAEDYKASLEYLTNNDRYAINNFTVIAKENTEHADAISNVLVEHIAKVRLRTSFVYSTIPIRNIYTKDRHV